MEITESIWQTPGHECLGRSQKLAHLCHFSPKHNFGENDSLLGGAGLEPWEERVGNQAAYKNASCKALCRKVDESVEWAAGGCRDRADQQGEQRQVPSELESPQRTRQIHCKLDLARPSPSSTLLHTHKLTSRPRIAHRGANPRSPRSERETSTPYTYYGWCIHLQLGNQLESLTEAPRF